MFGVCERSIPHGDGQARHLRFATYCCTDNPGNVQTDDPAVPEVPVTGTRADSTSRFRESLPGVRDWIRVAVCSETGHSPACRIFLKKILSGVDVVCR